MPHKCPIRAAEIGLDSNWGHLRRLPEVPQLPADVPKKRHGAINPPYISGTTDRGSIGWTKELDGKQRDVTAVPVPSVGCLPGEL